MSVTDLQRAIDHCEELGDIEAAAAVRYILAEATRLGAEVSRSTPPLDEWLKGHAVAELIAQTMASTSGAVRPPQSQAGHWMEQALHVQRRLLETLAEHRKEGQHGN